MTPTQKLKWAVLARAATFKKQEALAYPCPNVDELYAERDEHDDWCDHMQDGREEVRSSGTYTSLECESSRHYESSAVAMKMPDGSWVGWTYWYGGGKHGEPSAIDWLEYAYDVECKEEEKLVVVRTFLAK